MAINRSKRQLQESERCQRATQSDHTQKPVEGNLHSEGAVPTQAVPPYVAFSVYHKP